LARKLNWILCPRNHEPTTYLLVISFCYVLNELSVIGSVILKDDQLLIPTSLQSDILRNLHALDLRVKKNLSS